MSVIIEKKDKVFTVIINRPDVKNAVNVDTGKALAHAFREFEADDNYNVAVLCGAGDTFCAGWDLKAQAQTKSSSEVNLNAQSDGPMGPTKMMLSKPVIAAVSGHAVAGGLELALWCDLRVMEETAIFGVFCRRFGVPLVDGGTVRLPRLIGMSHAMDLILTGRPVAAAEAKHMGLANMVVAHGESRASAEALAAQIAQFPQHCLRSDRTSAYQQWTMPEEQALKNELELGLSVIESGETMHGAKSFSQGEGRHGEFK